MSQYAALLALATGASLVVTASVLFSPLAHSRMPHLASSPGFVFDKCAALPFVALGALAIRVLVTEIASAFRRGNRTRACVLASLLVLAVG